MKSIHLLLKTDDNIKQNQTVKQTQLIKQNNKYITKDKKRKQLLRKQLIFFKQKMQRHFRAQSSPRWPRVMTERASTQQEDLVTRSTTHAKIKFNHKSLGRGVIIKQPVTEYQSQRYSCSNRYNKQNKPQLIKPKIHKNLSQSKNISKQLNKPSNQEQNEDFLIRIPRNEDMIENYIQQLKQLKRKVFQQKQRESQTIKQKELYNGNVNVKLLNDKQKLLQQRKENNENDDNIVQNEHKSSKKMDVFLLKLPEEELLQVENSRKMSFADVNGAMGLIRKTEDVRVQKGSQHNNNSQHKIFCRDIKKHIKKLKMFKEYVDENQNCEIEQQYTSGKKKISTQNIESNHDSNNNNINGFTSSPNTIKPISSQPQSHRIISNQSTSIPLFYPKKIIYGNVIHLKQQFMVEPSCLQTATNRRFNRYSSQTGVVRKLSIVSKSIDMKGEEKTTGRSRTEENNQKTTQKSKSLVLRRKTQEHKRTKKEQSFHINNKFPLRPINLQNSTGNTPSSTQQKPQTQRSPTKQKSPSKLRNNTSPQKNSHPFKSIQGFSTIEEQKETLDILGESCLQIKNNLIESHKKMDHILDLLQGNIIGLEGNGNKEKKRKPSYERFSKAFPKDFFK